MKKFLGEIKKHVMSGISFMLPFIVSGSLLISLARIAGIFCGVDDIYAYEGASQLVKFIIEVKNVGHAALGLMNPVFAGYIAYSVAGKPGLAAGFAGGVLAASPTINAGFLGAALAGLFAGYSAKWIKENIVFKGSAASVVPMIILPLLSVCLTGLVMIYLVGQPLGLVNHALVQWIQTMSESGTNKIILALVMGGMIGFDLGGPINKTAVMAAMALFMSGEYLPLIINHTAISVAPLGYWLATTLRPKNYSDELLGTGKASFFMGFVGITEGAIPFTLKSPLKLITLNVVASAIASATAVALGVFPTLPPIKGIYGAITVGNPFAYLIGMAVGTLIIAIGANLLVDFRDNEKEVNEENQEVSIDFEF